MKHTALKLVSICTALLSFWACKKDEDRLVVQPGTAPTLTASSNTLVLKSEDATKEAVTFSWTATDYGYPAAVSYTLQFDKKGNEFKKPVLIESSNSLKKTFTVADFNAILLKLGVVPGKAEQLDVRVQSSVNPTITPLFSAASSVTGTPYRVEIQYPSLYVPGSYQGWAPDKATKIVSVKDDKSYEGYVYFSTASTEFKLTDAPNWNNGIFGDEKKEGNSGTIASPGENFIVKGIGYYLLKADLTAKKWSALKTSWGVIGSATAAGWDADTDLTFDPVEGVWKITADLKEGQLKFRANDTWDLNFGDNQGDGLLEYGGENINITAAGKYTIVLNLSSAGSYSYTLTK